ncbi:unnamed protein product [Rotaria sordida]|uniref:SRP54-type proteins GTP-binding domain-containing protein n=1 Tax=Rotaria sordida TaxID=392033 RepID=A0A813XV25_9BILA|nr:unnamed protein product [Rotaria sordida]
MNRQHMISCSQTIISPIIHELIFSIDTSLEYLYKYIELPLQNIFYCFGNISSCYFRRRSLIEFSRHSTQILVQSYAITFLLYFILLLFGHLFTISIQNHYFIDPFLSNNRQCINIKFVRIYDNEHDFENIRLKDNFIRENVIIGDQVYRKNTSNYSQLYELLHLLEDDHYMICQRSLYIYARFHAYSSLLHSNYSQFRFFLPNYPSFTIDQPPFLDLCIHTSNHTHLEQIKSRFLPLASHYYASINLFLFDFNFTQVSLTLYILNNESIHLERSSIHTGWLYDIYSRFHFFKYNYALSTVLFDGLSVGQHFIDYFDYLYVPLPADPLLALNEMVQQALLILPLCGLVLWCVPSTATQFIKIVNNAIDKAVLQGQGSAQKWVAPLSPHHIHYKLDNEFELVFILGYQKTLNISYADKFLNEIQKRFRDLYKDDLTIGGFNRSFPFRVTYNKVLSDIEQEDEDAKKVKRAPRSYEESDKKQKTVKIVTKKGDVTTDEKKKKKPKQMATSNKQTINAVQKEELDEEEQEEQEKEEINNDEEKPIEETKDESLVKQDEKERLPLEEVQQPTLTVAEKLSAMGKKPGLFTKAPVTKASPKPEKGKPRKVLATSNASKIDISTIDYSKDKGGEKVGNGQTTITTPIADRPEQGDLKTMTVESPSITSGLVDGFWSKLKKVNVFASKTLTADDLRTGIEAMREHLIAKNVAADVAEKICESVSTKLAGKTLGSFESLTTNIRQAMRDTLVMILTPKRRIDILRDVVDAQQARRPYAITFCGVNGVGKSTNLAKVAYWLSGNDLRVLIAGCDTFRAGAIEQLLTHVRHLNNIFNEKNMPMIELYQRGYGKDAAGIAAEAINYAKDKKFDVVLIDTAGRMQNDEPLMIALAKLIHVNNPDLVLFVGEALVGNEAVDQVTKFNQALIDNARLHSSPRVIDGIVLTKFDTIDDKVGAAISMTYTTDKPIVFVGIGQKYQDLKTLNADVVTEALLK